MLDLFLDISHFLLAHQVLSVSNLNVLLHGRLNDVVIWDKPLAHIFLPVVSEVVFNIFVFNVCQ